MALGAAREGGQEEPQVVITQDGQRIEIDGGLEEKGARVVFRDRQGRLLSLPRTALDFEAMRREQDTAPVVAESAPTSAAPILVLTDKDVPRFERARPQPRPATSPGSESTAADADAGVETGTSGESSEAETVSAVEVVSFDAQISEEEDGEESIEIWGSLQNTGTLPVDAIVVEVRLVTADGTTLANQKVTVSANVLGAGEAANFSAYFDGQIFYDAVEFAVSYEELQPGRGRTPGADR